MNPLPYRISDFYSYVLVWSVIISHHTSLDVYSDYSGQLCFSGEINFTLIIFKVSLLPFKIQRVDDAYEYQVYP